MDILDHLYFDPIQKDFLDSLICVFGESEVYQAICLNIISTDGLAVWINVQ